MSQKINIKKKLEKHKKINTNSKEYAVFEKQIYTNL